MPLALFCPFNFQFSNHKFVNLRLVRWCYHTVYADNYCIYLLFFSYGQAEPKFGTGLSVPHYHSAKVSSFQLDGWICTTRVNVGSPDKRSYDRNDRNTILSLHSICNINDTFLDSWHITRGHGSLLNHCGL